MSKLYRLVALAVILALALSVGMVLVNAQDDVPGPGEGGLAIRGNTRGSANLGPLVYLRCSGVDCADVNAWLWPAMIALDPNTQNYTVGEFGALANSYEVSEDGLTYTFSLRQDAFWNDGTPITATDLYFAWEASQQGEGVGLSSSYAPQAAQVTGAEIIDDYTIAFSFDASQCDALRQLAAYSALPAHAFGYTAGGDFDWASMIDHPFDDAPAVTGGPFNFDRLEPGTAIYLSANLNYYDPTGDYVVPQGLVFVDTPDDNVQVERLLANQDGDINFVYEPGGAVFTTLREASDAGSIQYFQAPGRVWHYVALNLADPANPQNGLDEDGNPIDQGRHPIFGDVRVRQALQHAINIDEVINGPLNGNATAMVAGTIPTAYTLNPDLARRPFDLEAARALLDEAGWTSTGDPLVEGGDGLRTCTACETADSGTPLSFEIMHVVNDVRGEVAVVLQNQFAQIGVEVIVTPLDFNTMYDNNMGAQTFDAAVAGWRGELPFNPDQRGIFGAENDIFGEGYGFNFPSYYNARLEELGELIATGNCDEQARIDAAYEVQQILYEEQPYLWLYALDSAYAATNNVQGFDPRPGLGQWNLDAWNITSAQ
ncbi:MAG: ABC transporter substrate-binding protein [bacterium]|nr:ABC transporter substrate-binding protein [bacterium]